MLRRATALLQHQRRLSTSSVAALNSCSSLLQRPDSESPSYVWALLSVLGGTAVLGASLLPASAAAEAAAPEPAALDPYAAPARLTGVPKDITVYQYEVCPFCNKVKAFLDYHKLPYITVEVSPLTKSELKWSDYRKVPLVMLDDEAVGDSTAVITRLAAELKEAKQDDQPSKARSWFSSRGSPARDSAAESGQDEERWRRWVDERLVRVVTVNIYRNLGESYQTFKYINDTGKFGMFEGPATRTTGATMMWFIARRLVKKYGIQGDLREELYAVAAEWVQGLADGQFMGGGAPNLADISAFGVIRSITGTDTFMDLMHNTKISEWYERMMAAVGDSSRLLAK
ncbi:hypothetical protein WJX73_005605 [Symbiochloris irregularis]|uniref:Prostaglandin E synthase 2 n=1 Tax=Symbiochloris irregularis TaxID=706552 RepID=A0AAW1NY40_9CHLO